MGKITLDQIESLIESYKDSDIHKYYCQIGEPKAAANAAWSLRMRAGLARKMALLSVDKGAHIKGGYASIKQLLQWQIDNDFRVCDLERTDSWKLNISKAHIGKKLSSETIEKLKNHPNSFGNKPAWNKGKTGYKTHPHTEETKQKIREKAVGKVISPSQRKKASQINSIPIIATNIKTGEIKEYASTKEAKEKLGLTGILHVLKGRCKQCGGYYFEYKKYTNKMIHIL